MDEKSRRNLMVFSTTVIAGAWLQVPMSAVLKKLLDVEVGSIPDWKLWATSFVAMIYLLIRYRFSSEGKAYKSATTAEYKRVHYGMLYDFSLRRARRFAKSGVVRSDFDRQLSNVFTMFEERTGEALELQGINAPDVRIVTVSQGTEPWNLEIAPQLITATRVIDFQHTLGEKLTLMTTEKIRKFSCNAWVWLRVQGYSEASITNVVPVYIACIAVLVMWLKVLVGYEFFE